MTQTAMTKPRKSRLRTSLEKGTIALAGIMCVLGIAFLVTEFMRELKFFGSAQSDNVAWVLSQAEVEVLELQIAMQTAQSSDTQDLDQVTEEFDVFYSRIALLSKAELYASLRENPSFAEPLVEIQSMLDEMVPLIDGPPQDLRANLAPLLTQITKARSSLRDVAVDGLQTVVQKTDQSRRSVSKTLIRLAFAISALVLALIILLRNTNRANMQVRRRRSELANAYARQNTILETSLDAVIVTNVDGVVLNFNAAAERIFQYTVSDIIGNNIVDFIIPDHLREAHSIGMKRMRANGEQRVVGHGRVKLEGKRKDGQVFPVEMALEKAIAGDEVIIISFLRDISHRVEAEKQLVDARDKALAGEKAKSEFLAMMTHEIRTPLNGILGNLLLLERTKLSQAQDRYVRNMDISGAVLMRHVDAVLDVARFESGTDNSQQDVIHLGRFVQDIIDGQASAAEAHGNHIQWGWVGEPVEWLLIDSGRLQQILLNLVSNAIKFTRNGRILIEVEQTPDDPDHGLEFRIIDTGIGISEENQPKVFDDFQTMGQELGGTGLGLGIARRFVDAMGGEISVESTLEEGSVFCVKLPLERAQGPELETLPEEQTQNVNNCSILLVEDNEINLQLAYELLIGMGHKVQAVRNGQEAVDLAEIQVFDLILMDIRMPVLNGLEATQQIRSGSGACATVPIVALSANVLPEARERFVQSGMSGFLPKPLDPTDLQHAINKFCSPTSQAEHSKKAEPEMSALEKLCLRYIQEIKEFFECADQNVTEFEQISEVSHKLAGSAAAFGQPAFRDALIAVEMAADTEDTEALRDTLAAARDEWKSAPAPSLG
ncbi:PAS domain-containing hybrid sensor histidine kinase/response regulator [Pelagimonas varians]|uniref:histidine kinase n=1 Tax=Pelagimonas varians TaxID=696760 RepID=A0A238K8N5_9RHOB|nr:PAS domain-containing hybrid sensor histidine kinase/response regulator [Pelagimonas varians]PYG31905.1 PAS domain S-box-containing protein [Pelagimonas varians]SMX38452.1 Autoinducer 2 sensor kinase/phosphatase LuxQ [Pelagimonas varians]